MGAAGNDAANTVDGWWPRVRSSAMGPLISAYNLFLFAVLKRPPFWPNDRFPFIEGLERDWKIVRGELDDLLENGPEVPPYTTTDPGGEKMWRTVGNLLKRWAPSSDPDQLDLDKWRSFVFRTYGRDIPPNRELCPKTAAILDEVPGLVGAMFSVLEPGAKLPTHLGLFPGALRCHLGLRVPEGDMGMTVAGIECTWEEGRSFVFEHTRLHRAWNDAPERRVVLILDIERPMPWKWLQRLNHSMVDSLRYWGRTSEAVAHIESLTP